MPTSGPTASTSPSNWTAWRARAHAGRVCTGRDVVLNASAAARIVLVGGQTLGRRFMSWNFVSSRRERIVAAEDWVAQRFPPVPGENEFVLLPSR